MIDQMTELHIKSGGLRDEQPNVWDCGCEHRWTGVQEPCHRWFLCNFHEGFDLGLDAARAQLRLTLGLER